MSNYYFPLSITLIWSSQNYILLILTRNIHQHDSNSYKNCSSNFLNKRKSIPLLRKCCRDKNTQSNRKDKNKKRLCTRECVHERDISFYVCSRKKYIRKDTDRLCHHGHPDKLRRKMLYFSEWFSPTSYNCKNNREPNIEALLQEECCLHITICNHKLQEHILDIISKTSKEYDKKNNAEKWFLLDTWSKIGFFKRKYYSSTHKQEKCEILPRMWEFSENKKWEYQSPEWSKLIHWHHKRSISILECFEIEKSRHCRDESYENWPKYNRSIHMNIRIPIHPENENRWNLRYIHQKKCTRSICSIITNLFIDNIFESKEKWGNESEGDPGHDSLYCYRLIDSIMISNIKKENIPFSSLPEDNSQVITYRNRSCAWILFTKRMIPETRMKWDDPIHLKSQENILSLRRCKEIHSFPKLGSLFDWILSHNLVLVRCSHIIHRCKSICTYCSRINLVDHLLIVCIFLIGHLWLYLATILDSTMKRECEKSRKIHMIRSCKFFSTSLEFWINTNRSSYLLW